ncbi:hypothetical protein COO60DRAFT_1630711 [Scenedesmus sp. NREL 46B-D3]|nr:hypothetical protein COO60DRAFT_1630711 [Scenedesmus sp. NREL 46B-D3]
MSRCQTKMSQPAHACERTSCFYLVILVIVIAEVIVICVLISLVTVAIQPQSTEEFGTEDVRGVAFDINGGVPNGLLVPSDRITYITYITLHIHYIHYITLLDFAAATKPDKVFTPRSLVANIDVRGNDLNLAMNGQGVRDPYDVGECTLNKLLAMLLWKRVAQARAMALSSPSASSSRGLARTLMGRPCCHTNWHFRTQSTDGTNEGTKSGGSVGVDTLPPWPTCADVAAPLCPQNFIPKDDLNSISTHNLQGDALTDACCDEVGAAGSAKHIYFKFAGQQSAYVYNAVCSTNSAVLHRWRIPARVPTLVVTKSGPATATVGDTITYLVTAGVAAGSPDAAVLELEEVLDSTVAKFVEPLPDLNKCQLQSAQWVTCSWTNVAPGAPKVLAFTPTITLAKTGPSSVVNAGDEFEFVLTAGVASGTVTSMTLTDTMPDGLTLVKATPATSCVVSGNSSTCTLEGSFPQTVTLTAVGEVKGSSRTRQS